jgi:hypothetical protein
MSVFYFPYNFHLKLISTHEEFSKISSKINVGLHVKYLLFWTTFKHACVFSKDLRARVLCVQVCVCVCVRGQDKTSHKSIQHEWSCFMYERWKMDRCDEANSYFLDFTVVPKISMHTLKTEYLYSFFLLS